MTPAATSVLERLAHAHGVATGYDDADGVPHRVPRSTVVDVLARLGVDAATPAAAAAALTGLTARSWARLLSPSEVIPAGREATLLAHAAAGTSLRAAVVTESGQTIACSTDRAGSGRRRDLREERRIGIPALPAGWHVLTAEAGPDTASCVLIVAPDRVRAPDLPAGGRRVWGWTTQRYAMGSSGSWGVGDLADLAELARRSGRELGAGIIVCNPLHAPTPVSPVEDSPYSPSSRLFHNPLYLRVEATPEYRSVPAEVRRRVDAERPAGPDGKGGSTLIDREQVWRAKSAALQLLFDHARPDLRVERLRRARAAHGSAIDDFALFCALAELHGRNWPDWPAELHRPDGPRVRALRTDLAPRVDFHVWLQALCEEQLVTAADAARQGGLAVGIVHDLAVGVDPAGADAWARPDLLVPGVTIGAPPDGFYQSGQDWGLPPWSPVRLAQEAYTPFRDVLRASLCGARGLRIDHVLGLFRLWCIPPGAGAAAGTYVHYDHRALLAVLALEASRAGALVIGEDLGTVQPQVARELADRGVLGSEILWFARDGGTASRLKRPASWRPGAAAGVTTHDLPTAAGFLSGDHVRLRAQLGLLARTEEAEAAAFARERAELLDLLAAEGLLPEGPAEPHELVYALYALLTRTPCRLLLACPADAIGDLRQPNLPGTDRYPNWRLPLAEPTPDGPRTVLLEEFLAAPGVRRLADLLGSGPR